jgi:hypothetical protein
MGGMMDEEDPIPAAILVTSYEPGSMKNHNSLGYGINIVPL